MVTLRQVEITDATILYYHLSNPRVLRYSRLKPNTVKEMEELIVDLISNEKENRVIPRVIINEFNQPIGMIILWDYCPFRREGFLATWIGEDYWGKGYNQIAKSLFFDELFKLPHLECIYLLIRKYNQRSIAACLKLPYVTNLEDETELREMYKDKISFEHLIFCIYKNMYTEKELSI